uniref:Uncharacterized protein n=1 Tax=Anguilla anguilla TaxID=7936 RepID=A0A0E9SPS2_ANGAN
MNVSVPLRFENCKNPSLHQWFPALLPESHKVCLGFFVKLLIYRLKTVDYTVTSTFLHLK